MFLIVFLFYRQNSGDGQIRKIRSEQKYLVVETILSWPICSFYDFGRGLDVMFEHISHLIFSRKIISNSKFFYTTDLVVFLK